MFVWCLRHEGIPTPGISLSKPAFLVKALGHGRHAGHVSAPPQKGEAVALLEIVSCVEQGASLIEAPQAPPNWLSGRQGRIGTPVVGALLQAPPRQFLRARELEAPVSARDHACRSRYGTWGHVRRHPENRASVPAHWRGLRLWRTVQVLQADAPTDVAHPPRNWPSATC